MLKKSIISIVIIFILWSVLDFVIHGIALKPTYDETAHLWRPEAEMKMGLMSGVTLVSSILFTLFYGLLINPKSVATGLKYGLLLGLLIGVGMGVGTYCYMPIPLGLGIAWMAGRLIELLLAGLILGVIMKQTVEK